MRPISVSVSVSDRVEPISGLSTLRLAVLKWTIAGALPVAVFVNTVRHWPENASVPQPDAVTVGNDSNALVSEKSVLVDVLSEVTAIEWTWPVMNGNTKLVLLAEPL